MKCPKCQSDNREAINYCEECGAKLELECPACKAKVPLGKKFCGECGHKLNLRVDTPTQDLSFDQKIEKIQRYLPQGLTEKILSQRDRIEGERKQVTVMFCDLAGFTPLSEKLGIEDAYAIMDQVYEILIHKVHDYEGTVNEMTGDGIMALFGAPIALEDAPQRAIRSAYAIQRAMTEFSDKMRQERLNFPRLQMRIGIHSGPVVVGTLGNDLRVDFKAVGDTVNLASRMERLAEPGTTCATEDTFKLTEGFFRFEALGEKKVKGKDAPMNVYQVIAPSTRRTRFDVSAERGLSPFVGRERELELLLDSYARVKAGKGQAFSIMAEAGLGKSRLLYELRKTIANENVTFLEGKCLSYSRGVAFHPVIDILKSNFYIRDDDKGDIIGQKVREGLKILGAEEAVTLPDLLELLGVEDGSMDKVGLSPEAKKERLMEAVKRITLKGSEIRTLVIAVEDLHWSDKSTEDSLKFLLDAIAGARIFLIFTYRPEFVPAWGGRSFHSQVTLNRLSNRECASMIAHLLDSSEVSDELENLILEKTEGVPFFIEEFVKSLKDLNLIEMVDGRCRLAAEFREVKIPSTIHDVIMARVDVLPEGAKELLQTASVIEREFSYELLKRVADLAQPDLLSHLSVLKNSELLYERGVYPESILVFRHALTRQIVYDSILSARKKKLHAKIGNIIEDLYRENLDEHYGELVDHYLAAEDYEKAARYSKLGGTQADRTGSVNEAIEYAKKRILCLERLPKTEDVLKKIIDIRAIFGLRMLDLNWFHEAQLAIKPILDVGLEGEYTKRRAQINTVVGACEYCLYENFPKAFHHLEQALEISEESGDIASFASASYWIGYALSLSCEFEKAQYYIDRCMEFNASSKHISRVSIMKSLKGYLGYFMQGQIESAFNTCREAIQTAEQSGDIFSKGFAYATLGVSCYGKGFLEDAAQYLLKGAELSDKVDQHYWNQASHHFLGEVYFTMGDHSKAQQHFDKTIGYMEQYGFLPSWLNLNKMALARVKATNKAKEIGLESFFDYASDNRVKQFKGWMARYLAEILIHLDREHWGTAENWINKAIATDQGNGMKFHLGKDYVLYADLLKMKNEPQKAREKLGKAIEIFKQCGGGGWVQRYERELVLLQ